MAVASTSTSQSGNGASSASTAAPSPTLYIKNIEGKIKKPELRRQLHTLFSTYGRILDVVATRAPSMRGQAFVVFETPATASAAKRALSGFAFYGKPLHIDFSTGDKSRALLRRELGSEAVREMELERSRTTVSRRGDKRALGGVEAVDNEEDEAEAEGEGERKRIKLESNADKEEQEEEAAAAGATIHARSIPTSIEASILDTLFASRAGFRSITSSSAKEDDGTWAATIKFDSHPNAEAAHAALNGVQLDPLYTLNLHVQ
ncbi:hypothetical protein EX895_002947 [Sporisorium graminicola]|uniref:RRM domain-containing protein n=1 Tax=Sporisorium graminicola TaxID=280036 RepID=A0A4U7KVQ7_9BASI|nr:hypothetical protein EX895_002947 [Sporisorium graminicola]TKY88237.1 hypothetical protein EX895_002947 [Sporisorium graminicola]